MDFRKIPNITVDCILFGFNANGLHVLLKKRFFNLHDPQYAVIDDWILTGGSVYKTERFDESALRIFKHYTQSECLNFRQFRAFGNPERIRSSSDLLWLKSLGLNHRMTSVSYFFLLPTDAIQTLDPSTEWFPLQDLPQLGFDHQMIISSAYEDIKSRSMFEPLVFEMLPDKFTLNELLFAYESLLERTIDNRNFRKKIITKSYIIQLDEKRVGGSKKPSSLYMFSRDIFDKTNGKRSIITL